jgi:hypothetical protein
MKSLPRELVPMALDPLVNLVVGVQVFPQMSDVVFKLSTTPVFK